ncbi:response regulator [Oceanospirillum linum]|uniref:DNA-binding response regulator n=1 Tax=Oceanospirillum linum TaxID=966 RepID=A0A1T1HDR9_OCELI|nr:response regulator transcription factor [Oceanospirillum linum]OOV87963.1 DNA-binding response regulator [Oceanospirillum linum]SEG11749.1 DNA-binding response regulator, NarL/FixJ family, contains REC and HTH domains [Oleiphilus messinensis]SMP09297.1 two component transcriptional regulator, LuxR family [Oceanospirillum linum]
MYKIVTADDHPMFREAIASVVRNSYPDSEIMEACNLDEAFTLVTHEPDIDLVLLDLNMDGMDGFQGLMRLREAAPSTPIAIVSAEDNKKVVLQAITFGAVGFITKSSPRQQMHKALEHILSGNVYLPSDIIRGNSCIDKKLSGAQALRQQRQTESINPALLSSLTRRQIIVLQHMAEGESNKQIAYTLSIAETTVKAHVSAILRKLGVKNRIQAVIAARDIDFSELSRC